jgi:hypothetical protein
MLLLTPSGAARFTTMQIAKPVEAYSSISLTSYLSGAGVSGGVGVVTYGLMNISNIENITPANVAVAFGAGAVGAGFVRRELNTIYGLKNTAIPYTPQNLVTHLTGWSIGYGSLGWMNSTNLPSSGVSSFTQPVWPNAPTQPQTQK